MHPNALKKLSKHPEYVSGSLQEYKIYHDGSLWRIKPHKGGQLADRLKGAWTSIVDAEQTLISYLKSKDKFNRAIYPNASRNDQ